MNHVSHSTRAVSHSTRAALLDPIQGAARLWARHERLGCLLFAVAATLAIALVERALGLHPSQGAPPLRVTPRPP